jgi:4-amino-4-deoxy-L-arabinose transferase-like glycosyltransferase
VYTKSNNKYLELIILLILAGFLFFFKLGSFSLYDAAETTYGEFIKQIRLTGDWITMHYNGAIIFDKPPLYFWLANLAANFLGFNEFAIRFWSALSGIGLVITTYFLGKSFYNQRAGFFSAIIAMTSFQFLIQSRIAELDILLTLLLTLSFLFFWYGYKNHKPQFYWLFFVSVSLATLVKGLLGIALPAAAIFLFLLFKRELNQIKKMQLLPGIIIILAIASPWFFAEWHLHGEKFTEFVLGFLFLSRFKGVVSGHPGPWYYYFLSLLFGFAPWSHFLPFSLWRTWKQRLHSPQLLSLCYVIPVFIVFSVAKTKLPNYLLPLFPFLAISVAKLWDDFLNELGSLFPTFERNYLKIGMIVSNIFLGIITVLIIIGFIIFGTSNYSGQYQEMVPNLLTLAAILIGGSTLSIAFFVFRKYMLSFTTLPAMVFIIAFILTTQTLPRVENYKGTKALAKKVKQTIKEGKSIAAYEIGNRPGVVFYNSKPVVFLENKKSLLNFIRNRKGYCFTTLSELKNINYRVNILDKSGDLAVIY